MSVSWKNDLKEERTTLFRQIESLAKRYENSATLGLYLEKPFELVLNCLDFSEGINLKDAQGIVRKALSNGLESGVLSSDRILTEIQRQTNSHLSKPLEHFRIIVSLSINNKSTFIDSIPLQRHMENSKIRIARVPPTDQDYMRRSKDIVNRQMPRDPQNYSYAIVKSLARTKAAAVDDALFNLDYMRGIWNLLLNFGFYRLRFSRVPEPPNDIVLGPTIVAFAPGAPVEESDFWRHNSTFQPIKSAIRMNHHSDQFTENERYLQRKLGKHVFRKELRSWIVDYCHALDYQDLELAFVSLWRVLEKLSLIEQKDSHTHVAKRIAGLFRDPTFDECVLTILATRRHEYVHQGTDIASPAVAIRLLREYVERTLVFYIENNHGFRDINSVREFLKLGTEKKSLSEQIKYANQKIQLLQARLEHVEENSK